MKAFLDENFLLHNNVAQELYHDYAKDMPIIDYHCHLPPDQIAADKQFENLTQIWLYGDHYKWRGMRTNGVAEKYCTGDTSDYAKFEKWAETVPYTIGNPLYHWTHLELQRYFGISTILSPATAREIYNEASAKLQTPSFTVKNLLLKMKVEVIGTTDDPADSLEFHKQIKESGFSIKVLPSWRPDKAMAVENAATYNAYIDKLGMVAGLEINTYDKLMEALQKRHDFFHAMGSRLSDHGLETFYAADYTQNEINQIFLKVRSNQQLDSAEILKFKSAMLYELALMDHAKGWTQQFHIGALRNNNSRMFRTIGPDTGFDSIGDFEVARPMSRFLDRLDSDNRLTKTIVYNLNPRDNELLATMIGNFNDGSTPGKIQFGSGWWFLDQKNGMLNQLTALANLGMLSRFVGMLTDSRSFLSYPRHEYFRRLLCNYIGTDVMNGELPHDMALLGKMVQDISFNNARNYFGFYE